MKLLRKHRRENLDICKQRSLGPNTSGAKIHKWRLCNDKHIMANSAICLQAEPKLQQHETQLIIGLLAPSLELLLSHPSLYLCKVQQKDVLFDGHPVRPIPSQPSFQQQHPKHQWPQYEILCLCRALTFNKNAQLLEVEVMSGKQKSRDLQ